MRGTAHLEMPIQTCSFQTGGIINGLDYVVILLFSKKLKTLETNEQMLNSYLLLNGQFK